MRELFRLLKGALEDGQDAVLVTVVASSGSTPRGAGARMLITGAGRLRGTIGGGAVEYRSEQMAADVLRARSSRTESFILRRGEVQDLGMICGGDVTVYFRFIPAGDTETLALTERIEAAYAGGDQSWLITEITDGRDGGMAVYGRSGGLSGIPLPHKVTEALTHGARQVDADGRLFYCEELVRAGRVYIFGGGHVSQALVPALAAVDFHCVVLEDREDFANPALFPGVQETRLIDNARIADAISIQEEDYVVIMTRGHKDDRVVLAQALRTPARYIGCIGSAKKTEGVFAILKEEGFTDRDLARVMTPIGLRIRAETPAEIAVSITAQLILHRAERA